ncbi:3'-5' exonuclease [Clostridium ganghwense]|uniref:Exonuclease domain-containing protein n=1 Tax=Clostridium ganghwense TaxID=312089 RepID=A0ABT4CT90_9CLOT|nr:3'-5' exonuclease [Clostridium ganghwense]MCY6372138.1 exonuclease domain-containing protein [Clostridium ganghwense]
MNYIIFDLEFNQGYNSIKRNKNAITPKCPFEIIQIGAVKLDENFETISTLDRLIKPEIYNKIHHFVKEITGITMEQLNKGKPFNEIYKELIEFVKNDRSILCVWGMGDMKELFRNIQYHELDTSLIPKEYINIQSYASKYLKCPKGTNIGLRNAVELLHIPIKNQFHDAFNDAYYTAEIFKKIYNEKIIPKIYNLNKHMRVNRQNNGKTKIDTYKLIKQFEKMFDREMTIEEKSIIKLAYMMGKTNQFEIKNTK